MNQTLFAKRLRALRHEKHLSMQALSEEVSVGRDAVQKWEMEQRLPKSPETYEMLASFFDVSIAYLKGDTDERGHYVPKESIQKKKRETAGIQAESDEHVQHIMNAYRSLSIESRELIDALIEKLCRTESREEPKKGAATLK